jgi:hypothetical protein
MTLQDPNEVETLLQQAKLKHQKTDDAPSINAQQSPTDGTDDLLAQLKENHQTQPQKVPENCPESQENLQAIRLSQQQKKQALTEVEDQGQKATDDLLIHLKTQHQTQEDTAHESTTKDQDQGQKATDNLLTHLKSQHQTQEDNANEYRENLQEICLSEQQKQQQIKQLTEQAKTWLKELDPYSDEGFWFAQFAESYETRLDAAIDYLSALET